MLEYWSPNEPIKRFLINQEGMRYPLFSFKKCTFPTALETKAEIVKINIFHAKKKWRYLLHYLSDKGLKGFVVNWLWASLNKR